MVELNFTPPTQAVDINNNSFFNTGCIDEVNKAYSKMETFKVEVINNVSQRFRIALFLFIFVVLFKFYVQYSKPKWSESEIYVKYIAFRIDWIMMLLLICTVALMFV